MSAGFLGMVQAMVLEMGQGWGPAMVLDLVLATGREMVQGMDRAMDRA